MKELFSKFRQRVGRWAEEHAETPQARRFLALHSFAESSFFPIPTDVTLIGMILGGERDWKKLALITTIWSVLGGIAGYLIGFFLFETIGQSIVSFYHLEDELLAVEKQFSDNAFFSIFVSAFTPIPYKVFTIAGGVFSLNLLIFTIASFLGRGLRFGIVAFLTVKYGKRAIDLFERYLTIVTILLVLGVLIYFLL